MKNSLSVLGVVLVGAAGWAIAWQVGVWRPSPVDGPADSGAMAETAIGAKILGYTSAVCYLGYVLHPVT